MCRLASRSLPETCNQLLKSIQLCSFISSEFARENLQSTPRKLAQRPWDSSSFFFLHFLSAKIFFLSSASSFQIFAPKSQRKATLPENFLPPSKLHTMEISICLSGETSQRLPRNSQTSSLPSASPSSSSSFIRFAVRQECEHAAYYFPASPKTMPSAFFAPTSEQIASVFAAGCCYCCYCCIKYCTLLQVNGIRTQAAPESTLRLRRSGIQRLLEIRQRTF